MPTNAIITLMIFQNILDKIVLSYTNILENNIVGIYLHGSLAMECATKNSDIDLLVIVNEPLADGRAREMVNTILELEDIPAKGIEMSVVLREYCNDIVYPTPFELHYSDYHKEKYLKDRTYICGNAADEDLVCHFMVTKHRGKCLYGAPIDSIFGEVPEELYVKSIMHDIADAKSDIEDNPTYHILNLCRTWAYLEDKKVLSKLEGGQWAVEQLPNNYKDMIIKAMDNYADNINNYFNKELLDAFVLYMYDKFDSTVR